MKRGVHLLIEFPVRSPLKVNDKQRLFDELTNICGLSGARNVSVVDSYYISGKSPERPQTFELVISMTAPLQSIISVCDITQNTYAYPNMGFYPRFFLKHGTRPFIDITNDKDIQAISDKLDEQTKKQKPRDKDEVIVDSQIINNHEKASE